MKQIPLFSYKTLKKKFFLCKESKDFLLSTKEKIKNIFFQKEKKIIIFTGPCSIHDEKSALLYAKKLKSLQKNLKNIFLIMRVFYEKPRSKNSWNGFLYDPDLNNSCNVKKGIIKVRKLLLKLTKLKIPISCEFLDPNTSYYFDDLISWAFIGARTSASMIHRHFASCLSIPVGFKNSIDGDVQIAINSAIVAKNPHSFVGINENGNICQTITKGNIFSHIVLRGSGISTNYDKNSIENILKIMKEKKKNFPIIIDCSHGNTQNDYNNQINVFEYVIKNLITKNYPILGLMLESHLNDGKQNFNLSNLKFGFSITDPCISFEKTKNLLLFADDFLKKHRYLH
jgi:3-deoxy-7-phosphoheptulonate synthase